MKNWVEDDGDIMSGVKGSDICRGWCNGSGEKWCRADSEDPMVLKWCWDMLVGTGSHAAPSAMQCYTGSAGSKLSLHNLF